MLRCEEWGINLLRNKPRLTIFPKQLLFRLTSLNVIVLTAFVGFSSWAIYNTACVLAEGFIEAGSPRQANFEATLLQYLWIFSISTIIVGSSIHYYLTKKLMQPLKKLITSTKKMKKGEYPQPIIEKREDEMGELIHQFNGLIRQIENNEEQRKKLVSNLSHEFRTPLSNLRGYLQALETEVIQADTKIYQSLSGETTRLIQLVEQMEQLKEWDYRSQKSYSHKTMISIKRLVQQAVDMFRWKAAQSNISLQLQVEPCDLHIDEGAIIQAISNFLDNAIRYYEGTEGISIIGEKQIDTYKIMITGPGKPIPKKDKERIFERFYRMEESRLSGIGGAGLGLAISKEIIQHHQGRIGLHSDGNVHTFWFTLPLD